MLKLTLVLASVVVAVLAVGFSVWYVSDEHILWDSNGNPVFITRGEGDLTSFLPW
jgi:hypothetical protein